MLLQTHNRFRRHNCYCSHSPLNLWCISIFVSSFKPETTIIEEFHTTKTTTKNRWHHESYFDCTFASTTTIEFCWSIEPWKSRCHWSLHMPPHASKRFCTVITCPRAICAYTWSLLTSSIISSIPHQPYMTSSSRLLLMSSRSHLLTSSPSLADVICLRQRWPVTVELTECWLCWRWMLTSLMVNRWLSTKVDFLQSRYSLLNFLHRFHFCSPFLHILLLNEEKEYVFFLLQQSSLIVQQTC